MRTLAVGFRLAPEHPVPAAYDDALTAWRWLRQQGIAARNIVVGGDSAGGGLTIALTLRLRDAGEELPGCLWLCSPWMDLTMSGATLATKDAVDPRISPLFANLHGLPPTLIQVGSAETLLDDSVRLAGAAGAAGVAATLEIWPDMIHAWALWNAKLEAGRQSLISAGEFMRRHL
jgi:monoterpene epsilon-lactone hydrolase